MVKAVLLGLPDDEVWKYNEAAIFGLPEPDREVVLPQVRDAAQGSRAEPPAPPAEPPAPLGPESEVREGRTA